MIKRSNEVRTMIGKTFGNRFLRTLIVSNPTMPKLYGLPKIHKIGNKMRPIVSNINAPCYSIAKWLVAEFKKLKPIESLSVKNSFEFVERMKDVQVNRDEIMVSFDVESLFPSIPIEQALIAMEEHLLELNIEENKRTGIITTARSCMKQNFFQFRNKFYSIEHGTSMGNPLSPLVAEIFMAKFEMDLKRANKLPRVWIRYVDDVFAIIKRSQVNEILSILNGEYDTINFTCEIEKDERIPFLDLLVKKKMDGTIDFGVYHKPTSTKRCITNDSNCPI